MKNLEAFKVVHAGSVIDLDFKHRDVYYFYLLEDTGFRIDIKEGKIYDFRKVGLYSGNHDLYEISNFSILHITLNELYTFFKANENILLKIVENSKQITNE